MIPSMQEHHWQKKNQKISAGQNLIIHLLNYMQQLLVKFDY